MNATHQRSVRQRRETFEATLYSIGIFIVAVVILALLPSCTLNPTIYLDRTKDREIISLGGSVLTKSKTESAMIQRPDGTTITVYREGKDEVAVPRAYIQGQTVGKLADIAGVTQRQAATQETKRILSGHEVEKVRITAPLEAQTEQLRISTPTE